MADGLPDADDMTDRDLASPQFVSWSARREANQLLKIIGMLYPDDADLIDRADRAHDLLCGIDDALDAKASWKSDG